MISNNVDSGQVGLTKEDLKKRKEWLLKEKETQYIQIPKVFDLNIDKKLKEKQFSKPQVNHFFNFGFNEVAFKIYQKKIQKKFKRLTLRKEKTKGKQLKFDDEIPLEYGGLSCPIQKAEFFEDLNQNFLRDDFFLQLLNNTFSNSHPEDGAPCEKNIETESSCIEKRILAKKDLTLEEVAQDFFAKHNDPIVNQKPPPMINFGMPLWCPKNQITPQDSNYLNFTLRNLLFQGKLEFPMTELHPKINSFNKDAKPSPSAKGPEIPLPTNSKQYKRLTEMEETPETCVPLMSPVNQKANNLSTRITEYQFLAQSTASKNNQTVTKIDSPSDSTQTNSGCIIQYNEEDKQQKNKSPPVNNGNKQKKPIDDRIQKNPLKKGDHKNQNWVKNHIQDYLNQTNCDSKQIRNNHYSESDRRILKTRKYSRSRSHDRN